MQCHDDGGDANRSILEIRFESLAAEPAGQECLPHLRRRDAGAVQQAKNHPVECRAVPNAGQKERHKVARVDGKRRSGRTRKGSKWLAIALTEAALANVRTKDVYLAAQYRRLRPRRGHTRALGAVKHSIIVACWHMLSTGETYREAGGDYFTRLDPDKQTRRLVAQLERLGHVVTLQEAAAA